MRFENLMSFCCQGVDRRRSRAFDIEVVHSVRRFPDERNWRPCRLIRPLRQFRQHFNLDKFGGPVLVHLEKLVQLRLLRHRIVGRSGVHIVKQINAVPANCNLSHTISADRRTVTNDKECLYYCDLPVLNLGG
jgi:hypothetical protein